MAAPLSLDTLKSLIATHAPILRLHPQEQYSVCSIEYFLTHSTLIDSQDPSKNIVHPLPEQLPQGPKQGNRYWLEIEDGVKPGNFESAKAYVNVLWKPGMEWTDIQFWFFNAWNGPGSAKFDSLVWGRVQNTGTIDLSPLGTHVGDWEYIALRISNTTHSLLGLTLSQHGKNIFHPAPLSKFSFQNSHPIVYASLNGHANFPSPGPNYSEHRKILGIPVGLEFNLFNSTAEGGRELRCAERYEIVRAEGVVSPGWVGYPYRWGPEGTAVYMDSRTLGEFIKAALGDDAGPVVDSCVVIAASELLSIFVKANINGSAAPATQGPWNGGY